MTEGAGQEALAGARGAGDQDALVVADPLAAGEAQDEGSLQSSRASEVEVLNGGLKMELGHLEEPGEAPVVAEGDLPFQEEGQTVVEGEALDVGHAHLFFQGLGHAGEAELVELVEGLVRQHERAPLAAAA